MTDEQKAGAVEMLIDDIGDRYWREKVRAARTREDRASIAMNNAEDRYSAGSNAARYAVIFLLRDGLDAASDFIRDHSHHER